MLASRGISIGISGSKVNVLVSMRIQFVGGQQWPNYWWYGYYFGVGRMVIAPVLLLCWRLKTRVDTYCRWLGKCYIGGENLIPYLLKYIYKPRLQFFSWLWRPGVKMRQMFIRISS